MTGELCLLLLSEFVWRGRATGVDLRSVGSVAELARELGVDLGKTLGTDVAVVVEHVVLGVVDVARHTLGVQVHVLEVLGTKGVLDVHTVLGRVTPRGFGVVRVSAHGTTRIVETRPHRTHHQLGILEPVRLDTVRPRRVHLTSSKRSFKTEHFVFFIDKIFFFLKLFSNE